MPLRVCDIALENQQTGSRFDGWLFIGPGLEVVRAIAQKTNQEESALLETIVKDLLVNKGADWTSTILSEYLGLYGDSRGTFALALERESGRLCAHGAVFQSASNPEMALVAHIRTADSVKRLGLGTLVTEELTRTVLESGARQVILATDDKVHRIRQGERAAHGMYAKIGYTILAEKKLADTVDWLMVIDRTVFDLCQSEKASGGGRFPGRTPDEIRLRQGELAQRLRQRFSAGVAAARIEPVRDGDLANLFLLLNLSPDPDFQMKLHPWGVHKGPEFERAFVVSARPAIMDRDRIEDATLVLRDDSGATMAVCAACMAQPFTRHTLHLDFYCLPAFLHNNSGQVARLVSETMHRIDKSPLRPRPCVLSFTGLDAAKIALFQKLGFTRNGNSISLHTPDGMPAVAHDYVRRLE